MKNIYYKKTLPLRRVKVANFKGISEDWFSKSLPIDYAVKQENLKILNGSLVASQSPKSVDIAFDKKVKMIVPIYEDGVKLFCDLGSKVCVLESQNGEIVRTEIEKDFEIFSTTYYKYGDEAFLILATSDGLKKFENNTFTASDVTKQFGHICTHYYRIFATQPSLSRLEFSDDFAPFNWSVSIDEGGYINLPFERGEITALISFNQYLLVCQENGFTKITAYSEQEDFVVKSINSPNNIKKGSVADCGDFAMYATDKGLGIFDGYSCRTICEELGGFLRDSDVQAAVAGDYCYFLCKYNNEQKDNIVIAYSLVKKDYHIITCDKAEAIARVKAYGKERLLLVCGDRLEVLSDESSSLSKVWQSGTIDFGSPSEYKLLKSIEFGGKTIVDLKINADGTNHFFNVSHKRSFLLNLKGKEFEIEIVPKGKNINVPSPVLEYQILEEK